MTGGTQGDPAEPNPKPTPAVAAHHRLTRAVARALRQRCGLPSGAHVLVGVSGGADSVALLHALATLAPRRRWRTTLTVGHVQHHLRGDAAEHDAQFVATLADRLGLPMHRVDLDPPDEDMTNPEAWARRQRYLALAQMARDCGAAFIATAHHGDDQLETLMLRLLRGTSVTGLRGIAWRRRVANEPGVILVRPMLDATRADVLDFLGAIGETWCEDHTNADITRDRARLRHEVLPVLRDMRGDAARHAVRLADHARDMRRLLRSEVHRAYEACVHRADHGWSIDRTAARALPRVVLTGLLRRVLCEAGVSRDRLSQRAVGPIARAVRDGRGGERWFDLADGVRVRVTRERVVVTPAPERPGIEAVIPE